MEALKVIEALQLTDVDGLEAVVVVGGYYAYDKELQFAVRDSQVLIRVERNVGNMPELMAWADLAVSAGGSTVWELAFLGIPGLIFVTAHSQYSVANELARQGIFRILGWWPDMSEQELAGELGSLIENPRERARMSQGGRRLIDGEGPERLRSLMDSW